MQHVDGEMLAVLLARPEDQDEPAQVEHPEQKHAPGQPQQFCGPSGPRMTAAKAVPMRRNPTTLLTPEQAEITLRLKG